MTPNEAVQQLTRAYSVKFDSEPDQFASTIIDLAKERIVSGELFSWVEEGEVRKLEFHKDTGSQIEMTDGGELMAFEAESIVEALKSEQTGYVRKINAKQQRFCQFLAQGMSNGRAWMLAGYEAKSIEAARVCASRALKLPHVSAYYRNLLDKVANADGLTLAEMKRFSAEVVRSIPEDISEQSPIAEVTKKKFYDATGKITGSEVVLKTPGKAEMMKLSAQLSGLLDDKPQVNAVINLGLLSQPLATVEEALTEGYELAEIKDVNPRLQEKEG